MTLESKEETHHWKRVSLTGKMKIKVISARNLAAAHRKLDARVVVRINNQVCKNETCSFFFLNCLVRSTRRTTRGRA